MADVKRADIARLHHKIGETKPTEANRVLALVSVMMNRAMEWGYLPQGHPNPAAGITKNKERSRDRWVLPAEMPAMLEAIAAEPNIYIRGALMLLLLTGMRKSEVLTLRWEYVDLDRREIRLPDSKAGRSHIVPLSAAAVEVLRELPRMLANPFVIASTQKPGGHLVNISKAWLRVRKAAGVEDVTIHDLRRTTGSWLAEGGASLPLIGKVLNHSNASTTQIYARLSHDPARAALEQYGARVAALVAGKVE